MKLTFQNCSHKRQSQRPVNQLTVYELNNELWWVATGHTSRAVEGKFKWSADQPE